MSTLQHPLYWDAGTGANYDYWTCTACTDHTWRDLSGARKHEKSDAHIRAVQYHEAQRARQSAEPVPGIRNAQRVAGPLAELLQDLASTSEPSSSTPEPEPMVLDWDSIAAGGLDTNLAPAIDRAAVGEMANTMAHWLRDSEDDSALFESVTPPPIQEFERPEGLFAGAPRTRQPKDIIENPAWYPWPDKVACVLDVLRHLPRSLFSDSQMEIISWGMLHLGIDDLPSVSWLKDMSNVLQDLFGIRTIRYEGALGHVYYTNSLEDMIAQEMSNPRVGPHIQAYPEDCLDTLTEAWQARRWRHEIDLTLATPMIRIASGAGGAFKDFFTYEPVKLTTGEMCMPTRWFFRDEMVGGTTHRRYYADACHLEPVISEAGPIGYVVHEFNIFEVATHQLSLALPELIETFEVDNLPDPRVIIGTVKAVGCGICPWRYTADPSKGNDWRVKAQGHRVISLMMWLYCDDTSGNLSKKWNKHNSFLWTPAGLPREMGQQQYNVHFLATSNLAPPLEMLDGIVSQLEDAQRDGIWAWDVAAKELVLVIPVILGLLGDNPMQSEFACHIATRLQPGQGHVESESDMSSLAASSADGSQSAHDDSASGLSTDGEASAGTTKKKGRAQETLQQLADRARRFLGPMVWRERDDSMKKLQTIFTTASKVGGMTEAGRLQTQYGVKDTYQESFMQRIFAVGRKFRGSLTKKQEVIDNLVASFPEHTTSPVWRIKGLDPHRDTPVEILHVILLGFVKYLWRDAISRLNADQKSLLVTRLNSFNVSGLQISKLSGQTLVQYAGSLTGRDFRAVAQAAPFILYDLLDDKDAFDTWLALSHLMPLVWQPQIVDLEEHLKQMENAIDHFLNCAAKWTPRWFNKPKFHIIRHLPYHVRRFGPAILFATEAFESFNAVIRGQSVHSNRHAPSKDIAKGFAHCNRIRHFLSGGVFLKHDLTKIGERPDARAGPARHFNLPRTKIDPSAEKVAVRRGVGPDALALARIGGIRRNFIAKQLGLEDPAEIIAGTVHHDQSPPLVWSQLKISTFFPGALPSPERHMYMSCLHMVLSDGVTVAPGSWVLARQTGQMVPGVPLIARLAEIIQVCGSPAHRNDQVDGILLQFFRVADVARTYGMPRLVPNGWGLVSQIADILCTVNVQHNCADRACDISGREVVRQENEFTTQTRACIRHYDPDDVVLNTAQLRNGKHIGHFRITPTPISREDAIMAGATKEINGRKGQAVRNEDVGRSGEMRGLALLRGLGRGKGRRGKSKAVESGRGI
ncbi:hypothetical protein EW146_g3214 [Bondarzewia mesenterica]|uniref:Uncharacterized protein n=1 Tax=Bondarzewia mesenterica TaxID=1095465 RepID=A0A4S4LZQ3_9AGAM|nr:hypothetical protein EW146_g3214 [Bondarzewia mesenterica]